VTEQVGFECPGCVIKPKNAMSQKKGICDQTIYERAERIKTSDFEVMSGKQCSIKVLREV
jgi:hypothetical protein